jgi:hypothetical protein
MDPPHAISAQEWELLAFFEVEPAMLDPDLPWPVNNVTYRFVAGDVIVIFSVAPAYRDFTLTVERAGAKEIALTAASVCDIRYHEDRGSEYLEILLAQNERLELRLKPAFSLTGQLRGLI